MGRGRSQAEWEAAHVLASIRRPYGDISLHAFKFEGLVHPVDYLADELVRTDEYGLRTLQLPHSAVVVDVGCALGLVSIAIARRFPSARIVCIESDAGRLRYIRWNIRRNNVANVEVYHALIGDNETSGQYITGMSAGVLDELGVDLHTCDLPDVLAAERDEPGVYYLTVFLAQLGVTFVDLLKVDCEGCEYSIP